MRLLSYVSTSILTPDFSSCLLNNLRRQKKQGVSSNLKLPKCKVFVSFRVKALHFRKGTGVFSLGRALKQCFLLPKIEPNEVIAVPFLQINSSLICSVDISSTVMWLSQIIICLIQRRTSDSSNSVSWVVCCAI